MDNQAINILVAEKIFGLNVLGVAKCIRNPECSGHFVSFDGCGDVELPVYLATCVCDLKEDDDVPILGHIGACLEVVPGYCGSIAGAWPVVEKLKTLGIYLIIWTRTNIAQAYVDDDDYIADEKADTPALAICRAALKAVGVTVE